MLHLIVWLTTIIYLRRAGLIRGVLLRRNFPLTSRLAPWLYAVDISSSALCNITALYTRKIKKWFHVTICAKLYWNNFSTEHGRCWLTVLRYCIDTNFQGLKFLWYLSIFSLKLLPCYGIIKFKEAGPFQVIISTIIVLIDAVKWDHTPCKY